MWSGTSTTFALLLIGTIIFIVIYFSIIGAQTADPGVAWKIPYYAYPELREIHERFKESCQIPAIPEKYFQDIQVDETFQKMRQALLTKPDTDLWTRYELPKEETIENRKMTRYYRNEQYKIPDSEYELRLGCFTRTIPHEVEQFATEKIQQLMTRLGLSNRLDRLSDSRGTTYMPPGGFMEYHSNQLHYAGWRLYMHWLPEVDIKSRPEMDSNKEEAESYFVYQHPYDKSYRRIRDTNDGANMFRLRKPPQRLLWHGIYADTPRFSWGIWLPPELAQHLKTWGERI